MSLTYLDPLASFKMEQKAPRTVIVMTVGRDLFPVRPRHRARRFAEFPWSALYLGSLPTPGQILASMSDNAVGGESYDREWPERAQKTMW